MGDTGQLGDLEVAALPRPARRPRPARCLSIAAELDRSRRRARQAARRAGRDGPARARRPTTATCGQPDAGRGHRPGRRGSRARRPPGVGRGPAQRHPLARPGLEHGPQPATIQDAAVDVISDQSAIANVLMHYADRCQNELLSVAPGRLPTTRIDGRTRIANIYSAAPRASRPARCTSTRRCATGPPASYLNELAENGAKIRFAPSVPGRSLVVDREVALLPIPTDDAGRHGLAVVREPNVIAWVVATFEQLWAEASAAGGRHPPAARRDRARPDPRGDPAADGRGREGRGDLAPAVDLGAHLPPAHRRLHDPGRRDQPIPGRRDRRARRSHRQPRRRPEPVRLRRYRPVRRRCGHDVLW